MREKLRERKRAEEGEMKREESGSEGQVEGMVNRGKGRLSTRNGI